LKALKEISVSDRKVHGNQNQTPQIKKENPAHKFDLLKKTRREEILKIVKEKKEVSIKDIVSTLLVSGSNISEKTIQRELVSMVSDSLLYRTGEKRWARYSIK
jgi:predicted HTH transcriptional regulator